VEHVTTHQAQAEELLSAMDLLMEDVASYKSAVALLAVHSAIAFNDAVLCRMTGSTHRGEDHSSVSKITRKECKKRKRDASGIQHLEFLLSKKTKYSYNGLVDEMSAKSAADKARKFADWAYRTALQRELSNG